MEKVQESFYTKYARTQISKTREYINEIDWSNRFIGIRGSRGVGKTTLILQYIKKSYKPNNKVLYATLDNLYFSENSLYNMADAFHKKGGVLLALDEVHRYAGWATELKNIYDDMPDLKVVFTGSSLLHLQQAKADLSRRALMYNMPGLSFREFLEFETKQEFPIYSLEDILENHLEIAVEIVGKLKPLAYFSNYLNYGYYPFYLENKKAFHQKLSEVILTVLDIDIAQFALIPPQNIIFLKRLLTIIGNSVPFKPNIKSLSEKTGVSVNTLKTYLKLLADAELTNMLYTANQGVSSLKKPEKIYVNNPNLMFNLDSGNANIENIRETFFYNQVARVRQVISSPVADFKIDDYIFEIGGKRKTKKQVMDISKAFVVKDDIEIGTDNTIPLWLFGFLY